MRTLIVRLLTFLLLASSAIAADRNNKNFIIPLPININQADARVLDLALDGIGAKKAEAIVEYRELNGPFQSVDDLAQVKGIGPGTLDRNRARITVE